MKFGKTCEKTRSIKAQKHSKMFYNDKSHLQFAFCVQLRDTSIIS